ncbi:hypothetical protein [Colwellia sp. MB02u-9]|uniref:hypothetical protein n=1 Tax=Colwellia sp. MB02u-9 TaxID=2759823 RepID=UPI0015F3CBA1|nr:hypothetical protein [Colwellia sp. MB02u-9]MBA6294622.1 hypothetical protein [Colwellia sp. MB02u-9]
MTTLNKIAQVLVLSGMSCWVSIAQATDIEISQSTNINQQTQASQQVDSSDNATQISSQSDTSAQSDTQVKANSEEENAAESAPSESTAHSSSNTANVGTAQAFDNNSQLITRLSNDAGKNINVTSATAATLAQSLTQVTSGEFPALAESNTPENSAIVPETGSEAAVPNEAMPAPENVALNPTLDSATSFVNTSQVTQQLILQPSQQPTLQPSEQFPLQEMANVENISTLDTASNLSQSLTQVTSAESEAAMPSEAIPAPENAALNPTLDSATSFANTSQITQQLSLQEIANVQNITALDAGAQTSQALEQTINANVEDAITSSTQSVISENVNTQITSAVTEQINTELAAATAAEVVSTLTSDLALAW